MGVLMRKAPEVSICTDSASLSSLPSSPLLTGVMVSPTLSMTARAIYNVSRPPTFQGLLQLSPHAQSSFLALRPLPSSQGPLQPGCPFPSADPSVAQSQPCYTSKCHPISTTFFAPFACPKYVPHFSNSGHS